MYLSYIYKIVIVIYITHFNNILRKNMDCLIFYKNRKSSKCLVKKLLDLFIYILDNNKIILITGK
jgi:hypothetical protein